MSKPVGNAQVRARTLDGFAGLVAQHGGNAHQLIKLAGISPALFKSPDAPLPQPNVLQLLELSAQRLKLNDFGLQLAAQQDISVLGPIALMVRNAPTVREAIAVTLRYFPYHNSGAEFSLNEDPLSGWAQLRYRLREPVSFIHRHNTELVFSIAIKFLRLITSMPTDSWTLALSHEKGLTQTQYYRYLQCNVILGQPVDALSFPLALLDVPLDTPAPVLAQAAERFVSSEIHRFPLDISKQVEALVDRQLAGRACTLPRIAEQLKLSERTLQRRLQERQVHFEDIVDNARRHRANEYLLQTAIPLKQVADLLGYAEQSVFIRACRRWFGRTPMAHRNHSYPLIESKD